MQTTGQTYSVKYHRNVRREYLTPMVTLEYYRQREAWKSINRQIIEDSHEGVMI